MMLQLLGASLSLLASGSPLAAGGRRAAIVRMGPALHGSQQSRSPLVNWYAAEAGIELEMKDPRPSAHPFNQVPFLTDDDGVEVFESGAILLYLADRYGEATSAAERAAYTKWVVWSNSELDGAAAPLTSAVRHAPALMCVTPVLPGLCFGAVPGDHRVRGTSMDKPDLRSVAVLEQILGEREWLVGDAFSVADVAVGSYLNYVPIFFGNADLSGTPNIARYMTRCAERPAFSQAFGPQHAGLVKGKVEGWLAAKDGAGAFQFKNPFA